MDSALPAPLAHAALAVLALAPLLVQVPVNASIVLTAAITVLVGCWRSVKPEPPAEAMTKKVRGSLQMFFRNSRQHRLRRRLRGLPPAAAAAVATGQFRLVAASRQACKPHGSSFVISQAPLHAANPLPHLSTACWHHPPYCLPRPPAARTHHCTARPPPCLQDAMRFPLVGSIVLFSLFLAFKFLPKEIVNAILSGALLRWRSTVCDCSVVGKVSSRLWASVAWVATLSCDCPHVLLCL